MVNAYKKIVLLCLVTISFLIAGCQADRVYKQAEGNVADIAQKQGIWRKKSDNYGKAAPALVVNRGMYVDKTPISLVREPEWLNSHVIIRGEDLPFSYYSRVLVNGGGRFILTRYQTGLDQEAKLSMNYSGTLRGALDLLASKTGYVYTIHDKNIYWQALVTKTFDVAFMPGSADYMMGKTSGSSGSTSGGGSGTTVTAMIDDSAQQQYSNLKGTLSVWKDLNDGIKQLLSPDGKVMVSESTTTVTVRDRPSNVELVGKFIANLNCSLSKQVLVKIEVLDITLSSAYNYGINWNIVQRMFLGGGNNFVLNTNQGVPVSITALGQNPSLQTSFPTAGISPVNLTASTQIGALISALTQQGKVSTVTQPRVLCLNNQVSQIRIVNQEGYLASVQNTTVGGTVTGASTVTSQLTPGSLTTGFTLYVLPKIIGNKVIMQVNADLSFKNSITPISSQTGTSVGPSTGGAPGSFIQVPNVTQKQFNQRSVIGSGDTLILAGFRSIQNTANASQEFDNQALGGKGAIQTNIETIVLITPVILHGQA